MSGERWTVGGLIADSVPAACEFVLASDYDDLAASLAKYQECRVHDVDEKGWLQDRLNELKMALDNAGVLSDWINRARPVITDLMLAYERRIRSDCKSAEQIEARPWTCSEYIMAERLLADQPKAVVMLTISPAQQSETDDEEDAAEMAAVAGRIAREALIPADAVEGEK